MTETAWVALFASLPPTILALATLIAVVITAVRGNMNIAKLTDIVNGKFSEMLQAVRDASKVEGKVEALTDAAARATSTTVITDRRKTERPEGER